MAVPRDPLLLYRFAMHSGDYELAELLARRRTARAPGTGCNAPASTPPARRSSEQAVLRALYQRLGLPN